jgi:hypothetical protein
MLLQVDGASFEDIQEALSLLDGCTVQVKESEPVADPAWSKLPAPGSQRQAVLLKFFEGDWTRDDFRQFTDLSDGSIDPRIYELEQGGLIVKTGVTKITQYGGNASVLTLTEKAKRLVNLAPKAWFPGGIRV